MSTPISAMIASAARRSTPVTVRYRSTSAERGDHPVDLGGQLGDRPVQEVDLGQDGADHQSMMGPEATHERLF
jgi:hypothetical protein